MWHLNKYLASYTERRLLKLKCIESIADFIRHSIFLFRKVAKWDWILWAQCTRIYHWSQTTYQIMVAWAVSKYTPRYILCLSMHIRAILKNTKWARFRSVIYISTVTRLHGACGRVFALHLNDNKALSHGVQVPMVVAQLIAVAPFKLR